MADAPPLTSLTSLVQHFSDFLTVSIHTILYERHIYPKTSFLTTRAYNYPVRQNRHPAVCQWITDAVGAVRDQLLKCAVARVALVIFSPQDEAMERFLFDCSRFPVVPANEVDTPISRMPSTTKADQKQPATGKKAKAVIDAPSLVDIEEQFRAAMTKLTVCSTVLKPLPKHCTYTLAIELKDDPGIDPPLGHPQPWIPVEAGLQKTDTNTRDDGGQKVYVRGEDLGGARVKPVRRVDVGELGFEMWIEEGRAKLQATKKGNSGSETSSGGLQGSFTG